MGINESILQRTKNYFRCVGTLYETNLKREICDIKITNENGQSEKIEGERINGGFTVRTANGIHTFNVYGTDLTNKGKKNPMWPMYLKMLEWVPEIGRKDDEIPTSLNVEGTIKINDYVNQQGNVSTTLRWNVNKAQKTKIVLNEDTLTGTALKATLYIHSIKKEIVNEEETGRLLLTFYGADNKGTCFPVKAIVNEDLAEDFENCYEVGMTVPFDFELIARHVGGLSKEKKFGRKTKVAVNNGFDVQELILVGGEDEIEEPESLVETDENGNEILVKTDWINPVTMNKAIKIRENYLNELAEESKDNNKKTLLQTKKESAKERLSSKAMNNSLWDTVFNEDDDDNFNFEDLNW